MRSAEKKDTQPPEHVAVKVISKELLKGHEEVVMQEIETVQGLDHPHIIKLLEWFESKDKVCAWILAVLTSSSTLSLRRLAAASSSTGLWTAAGSPSMMLAARFTSFSMLSTTCTSTIRCVGSQR